MLIKSQQFANIFVIENFLKDFSCNNFSYFVVNSKSINRTTYLDTRIHTRTYKHILYQMYVILIGFQYSGFKNSIVSIHINLNLKYCAKYIHIYQRYCLHYF